jgi:hypothetical protein
MSETISTAMPPEAPKEPTAEEKRVAALKDKQAATLKLAQELNEKTQARVKELKQFEGKTFVRKDGKFPNQRITVIRYAGIATLNGGVLAHLFEVEAKNPGAIWTPPATAFLEEHEVIEETAAETIPQAPI